MINIEQLKQNKIKSCQDHEYLVGERLGINKQKMRLGSYENGVNLNGFRPYTATIINRTNQLNNIFYQNIHPTRVVARSLVTLGEEGNHYLKYQSVHINKPETSRKYQKIRNQESQSSFIIRKSLTKMKSTTSSRAYKITTSHQVKHKSSKELLLLSPEEISFKNNQKQVLLNLKAFPLRKYSSLKHIKSQRPAISTARKANEGKLKELCLRKMLKQDRMNQGKLSKKMNIYVKEKQQNLIWKDEMLPGVVGGKKITIQHY